MYLLDTNVVSEMRKVRGARSARAKIDPQVQAWLESVPASSLYLSVITILELEIGFHLLERRDPAQADVIRSWIRDHILPAFAGRILDVNIDIVQRCAALHVPDPKDDRDSLIAATALVHSMTVVTRNVSHFARCGVKVFNPWEA
ncbi:MAG: type II toxin-antitoxin system VapC family toxin [Terracidiphilus sp.]|nr:type II toxin-antitoxin system VapC family toxin [Terracidiphilus sp.]MDR3797816.1 type II toxin-antitoxin system VapC family toxin [Terracidiphilus sp.]